MQQLKACPQCHKAMTPLNVSYHGSPAWKGEPAYFSHRCRNCNYEVKGYGKTLKEEEADSVRRWNMGIIVNDPTLFSEGKP